jgi:adenylate cyclase
LEDVFDLQDEVTTRVVGSIEPSITRAEITRAQVKSTFSLDAYDLYLRALAAHYSQTRADIELQQLRHAKTPKPICFLCRTN